MAKESTPIRKSSEHRLSLAQERFKNLARFITTKAVPAIAAAALALSLQGEGTAASPTPQSPEGKRLTMDFFTPDDHQNQFYYADGPLVNPTDGLSEFMVGRYAVELILPESTGEVDPNQENWTATQIQNVYEETNTGFNWWPKFEPRANLSFVIESPKVVHTKYEPINHPAFSAAEDIWLNDVLTNMGHTENIPLNQKIIDEATALRDRNGADQAILVVVVNSEIDPDGSFTNFISGHTWYHKSLIVMTTDNDGFGLENLDEVTAHEAGHALGGAPDQGKDHLCEKLSPSYTKDKNGNSELPPGCETDLPSIMRSDVEGAYRGNHLDPFARVHIGWGDKKADGINADGILDSAGTYQYSYTTTQTANDTTFTGTITNTAWPPPAGWTDPVNFNFISAVTASEIFTGQEFQVQAVDGAFDSQREDFNVTVSGNAKLVKLCFMGHFGGTRCEIILDKARHQYLPVIRK